MRTPKTNATVVRMEPNTTAPPLLTVEETAAYLGVKPRLLESWRYRNTGPKYIRLGGRHVRYRQTDLDDWIAGQVQDPAAPLAALKAEARNTRHP